MTSEHIHQNRGLSPDFDHLFTRVCYMDKNPFMSDNDPKNGLKTVDPLVVCKSLRTLLKQSNISNAELSRRTGIHVNTLARWQSETEPPATALYLIEQACGWAPLTVLTKAELGPPHDPTQTARTIARDPDLTPKFQRLGVESYWVWRKLSAEG